MKSKLKRMQVVHRQARASMPRGCLDFFNFSDFFQNFRMFPDFTGFFGFFRFFRFFLLEILGFFWVYEDYMNKKGFLNV